MFLFDLEGSCTHFSSLVVLAAVSTMLVSFLMSLQRLLSVMGLVELPPLATTTEERRNVRKSDWNCMVYEVWFSFILKMK